jgi:beta-lactamase regulating signal transducer with metallopeptidase domain
MRELQQILETPGVRRLAWALIAFLWQGTLVAAILACLGVVLRRRDPRVRYAADCAALLLMLVLPAATYARHRQEAAPIETIAPAAADVRNAAPGLAPAEALAGPRAGPGFFLSALESRAAGLAPLLVPVWFCGALLLSLRFLAGWSAARKLPLRGAPAALAALEALSRLRKRMRISRPVLLLESAVVNVPIALGALRPVILLPVCAVTGLSREALEAVLAHEFAHIRRHDYFVNLLQTAAETLLFYHPAVWWVSRRIREERENCCDDLAVAAVGDSRGYARALLALEEIRSLPWASPSPAVAADGGSLRRRIARLLPAPSRRGEQTPLWLGGLLALAALATIGAAADLFDASRPGPTAAVSAKVAGSAAPDSSKQQRQEGPSLKPKSAVVVSGGVTGGVRGAIAGAIEAGIRGAIESAIPGGVSRGVEGGIEEEKPGPDDRKTKLSPEQLVDLKTDGATPEFLDAVAALGYKTATVEELLSVRVHGVNPEYISGMTSLLGKLSLDQVVSLKIHGVTPEFVKQFRDAGYTGISADETLSLRIHGVDPATAAEWKNLVGRKPGLDELVSARIHGATPEFARELRSLGLEADLDTLVSLRIHGVTPDFIRKANGSAGTRLSLDELVDRRIHGREK